MPNVYNRRDIKVPKDAVYVGRPTVFGNLFVMGKDGTQAEVIDRYEHWFNTAPEAAAARDGLHALRGKDLVCWCSPLPCHADVLLRLANAQES